MNEKSGGFRDRLRAATEGTFQQRPAQTGGTSSALWEAQGKPLVPSMGTVKVRVTDDLLYFEKGVLRTDAQQIPLSFVYDVDVAQSMTQKMSGVATLKVHVRRPEGTEIVVLDDMPDFRNGAQIINDASKRARHAEAQATNTHYFAGPAAAAPAAPQQSADDPMAQLQRLKSMHEAGLITDEEYSAKKADILGRL